MKSPLDDIRFLANSKYRVDVLFRLGESPIERDRLQEELGISQPTLSRVLSGLRERGWIRRNGLHYELTSSGDRLAEAFAHLEDELEESQKLRLIEELVPMAELDIDIELFAGATVITPTPAAPLLPISRGLRLMDEARRVRGFAPGVVPDAVEVSRVAITRKDQVFEMVITPTVVDVITSDATMLANVRGILSAPNAAMYVYDGMFPCGVIVADDDVFLAMSGEAGSITGQVESDDAKFRGWANRLIDDYLAESTQLTKSDFSGKSSDSLKT